MESVKDGDKSNVNSNRQLVLLAEVLKFMSYAEYNTFNCTEHGVWDSCHLTVEVDTNTSLLKVHLSQSKEGEERASLFLWNGHILLCSCDVCTVCIGSGEQNGDTLCPHLRQLLWCASRHIFLYEKEEEEGRSTPAPSCPALANETPVCLTHVTLHPSSGLPQFMTEGKGRKGRARKTGREETKEKAKPKPRRKQETPQPERVVKEEKEEKDFAQLNKEWQVDEDNRWRCEWDD